MQKFTILKASAGSGKTFNLARKYLEFAFAAPFYFKHILAVTFTNKATTELKSRILSEFYLIASCGNSAHVQHLMEALHCDADEIQQRAKTILSHVLQDFSNFHIYTIDGFFQGILKGFFRELGIHTQFNIELSQQQVLDKATDALFFELAETNNAQLINWLTRFSEAEVEEGNTWNLKAKIKQLGGELFTETYKSFTPPNENIEQTLAAITDLRRQLNAENEQFWNDIIMYARKIAQSVEQNGFSLTDFKGKSRSFLAGVHKIIHQKAAYIYNGSFEKYVDNPDQVAPAGKAGDAVRAYYDAELNALLKQLTYRLETDYPTVVRNVLILKNLYAFGVIKYVQDSIKKMNAEQNTILISDSNELIHKITSGSDAPFIYEKSGNKFWNYMIDEFQDTSRMQWNNLKPLVDNSLAYSKENLIVGDVKQSIYRWRNSDWKMLGGDIQLQYGDIADTLNLPANYRSRHNIIAFNNSFFRQAKQLLSEEWKQVDADLSPLIDMAYETSFQEFGKPAPGGFVRSKVIEAANKSEFQEEALAQLAQQIDDLLANGYQPADLVILVRKNTEGAEIINHLPALLGTGRVNFVSEDSYFLQASFVVQFIVSVLNYLQFNTGFYKSQVHYIYSNYLGNLDDAHAQHQFDTALESVQAVVDSRSLVNLVHEIIIGFNLLQYPAQQVFVLALLDEIRAFQNQNYGGLEEFLRYWENNKERLVIKDAQNTDAIRILTVHKSKGLEFRVVLIPFLSWDFDPRSTQSPILWCENPVKSSHLKVLPVRYSSKMDTTEFRPIYHHEKIQNAIDSLNLVYVAFTRAIEGLYFGVQQATYSKTSGGITNVSRLVDQVLTHTLPLPDETAYAPLVSCYNSEELSFTFGEVTKASNQKAETPEDRFEADFAIQPAQKNIKVRRNIRQNIAQYKKERNGAVLISEARMGTVLHRIFEQMEGVQEVSEQLDTLVKEGWLKRADASVLNENINRLLKHETAREWFQPGLEVLKEKELVTENGELLRPDRVVRLNNTWMVIDYKFGRKQHASYQKQVKKYMEVLAGIFSEPMEGAIWYVMLGKIEWVKC